MEENPGKTVLILRMKSVPAMDITAMNGLVRLQKECAARGIRMILSHVNPQPLSVMKKSGFAELAGEENFCANIDEALLLSESIECIDA